MSVLFAASHPERTRGLVLYGSFPRITPATIIRGGSAPEQVEPVLELADGLGRRARSAAVCRTQPAPRAASVFARLER